MSRRKSDKPWRKRSRNAKHWSTSTKHYSYQNVQAAGGTLPIKVPSVTRNTTSVTTVRSRTLAGPVLSWKWRIRHGQSATSTLVVNEQTYTWQPGLAASVRIGTLPRPTIYNYSIVEGRLGGTLLVPDASASSIDTSKADASALAQFVQKARNAQSAFKGMTFLGELRESLHMIKHPAQALLTKRLPNYHEVVKKRLRGVEGKAARQRMVRDTWLEYSFGWKPLISDILSGAKSLARYAAYEPDRQFVKAESQSESVLNDSTTAVAISDWNFVRRQFDKSVASVKYYGSVKVSIPDRPDMSRALRTFGFSWNEVLPTIWELIPYSFLVDYFTNVGDVISAFSFPASNFGWVAYGTKQEYVSTLAHRPAGYNLPDKWVCVASSVKDDVQVTTKKLLRRNPYVGSLVPQLRFRIPGMGLKWLNIASLSRFRSPF